MNINFLSIKNISEKKISLPAEDTIDICIFSIEDFSSLADSASILSAEEQKKSAVFRQEKDKLRYITSRILLRRILSLYLDRPAESLSFKTGAHGKPSLSSDNSEKTVSPGIRPEIHFNLSHSGSFVALAFSAASPVGIDIENIRENVRRETLVRRFFHPDEYAEFLKLDHEAQQDFLFRRWTVREAFLKGIGKGFSMSPESFYVVEEASFFRIKKSQEDYSSWRIMPVPAADGYYCSVAYQTIK